MAAQSLTLGTCAIRQLDGLYSLNDLHDAATATGVTKDIRPNEWMSLEQTKDLAEILITENPGNKPIVSKAGRYGGTYVCRELVYAYANWISPAFYLKMIRAFDALVSTGHPATGETFISAAQAGELSQRIAERFPEGNTRPYAWSRFNNHFRLASYKTLPVHRYEEALAYIDQMPTKSDAVALPSPPGVSINIADLGDMTRVLITKAGPQSLRLDFLPNETTILTSDEELVKHLKEPGQFPRNLLPEVIEAAAGRLKVA